MKRLVGSIKVPDLNETNNNNLFLWKLNKIGKIEWHAI